MELKSKIESIEYLQANGMCHKEGYPVGYFYPETAVGVDQAKAICRRRVVIDECLDYAIQNGEWFGVWGCTSERERRKIARRRLAA